MWFDEHDKDKEHKLPFEIGQKTSHKYHNRLVLCDKCHGTGTDIDFAVGLGQHGNVPSYVEQTCPKCGGSGELTNIQIEELNAMPQIPVKSAFKVPDEFVVILVASGIGITFLHYAFLIAGKTSSLCDFLLFVIFIIISICLVAGSNVQQ